MSDAGFVIHVATGETRAAASVDRWLIGNHVAVVRAEDPYAAVVSLCRETREPAMVVVGTDWLAISEHCLLSLIREKYPNALVAVYGGGIDEIAPNVAARLLRLGDGGALEEFLSRSFDEVCRHNLHEASVAMPGSAAPDDVEDGDRWSGRAVADLAQFEKLLESVAESSTLTPAEVATLLGEQKSPAS
ncbi:MAG: hypothetical protein JNG88_10265 [Phycisphaerales bacterium]|nr:hypothetical protein [Phycisphaerales bacterium]